MSMLSLRPGSLTALSAGSVLVLGAITVVNAQESVTGVTRTYFIAAEEVVWDYAPTGMNRITGRPFGEHEAHWVEPGPTRIGRVYKKARCTGSTRIPRSRSP